MLLGVGTVPSAQVISSALAARVIACKPAPAPRSWAWLDGDRAAGRASGENCKASVEVAVPTSARSDSSGTVHRRSADTHPRRSRTVAAVVDDGAQSSKAWDVGTRQCPASGAETGQTRWPQAALNGCDNAYPFTRNSCYTGISASSGTGRHCCGPGCRRVDEPGSRGLRPTRVIADSTVGVGVRR